MTAACGRIEKLREIADPTARKLIPAAKVYCVAYGKVTSLSSQDSVDKQTFDRAFDDFVKAHDAFVDDIRAVVSDPNFIDKALRQ